MWTFLRAELYLCAQSNSNFLWCEWHISHLIPWEPQTFALAFTEEGGWDRAVSKGRTTDWMYCSELPISCDLREITIYSSISARGDKTASYNGFIWPLSTTPGNSRQALSYASRGWKFQWMTLGHVDVRGGAEILKYASPFHSTALWYVSELQLSPI